MEDRMGVLSRHTRSYMRSTSGQVNKERSLTTTHIGGIRVVSCKEEPTHAEDQVSLVEMRNSKDEKERWNPEDDKSLTVQENNQSRMGDYDNQTSWRNPDIKYKIRGAMATYNTKDWVHMKRGVEIEDILCKVMREGISCKKPTIPAFEREINKVDQG